MPTIVMVPGYTNAGPQHWISHLEQQLPNSVRVQQQDWENPQREMWIAGLQATITQIAGPVVLVGHSCGAVAIAQWAGQHNSSQVLGALLVAPADIDGAHAIPPIQAQRPLPQQRLPFRSLLICSDNDDHCSYPRSQQIAATWGSELILIPGASHFHTEAGFGHWPAAATWITELSQKKAKMLSRV